MTSLTYFGGSAPVDEASTVTLRTRYRVDTTGSLTFAYGGIYPAVVTIDGVEFLRHDPEPGDGLNVEGLLKPPPLTGTLEVEEGQVLDLELALVPLKGLGPLGHALFFKFGTLPDTSQPKRLIEEAVELAARSDVAVVVVGTNAEIESEGSDRITLALPGHQDDLVRAVARANPNTIVVVNSGSPVILPWRDEVAAILVVYFPGQEFGHALADIIYGVAEPGGRLPTTWPTVESELPIGRPVPVNGQVVYAEGIHIGYRAWLQSGVEPAYPFGHGLGYTTWSLDQVDVPSEVTAGEKFTVAVRVTNTGERAGKQVVQVYAERPDSVVDRPVRWLVGFANLTLGAGESAEVEIEVLAREFAHFDGGWQYEAGTFDILAGFSVSDVACRREIGLVV